MAQIFFDSESELECSTETLINESNGNAEKHYKIKGIFSTIGEKNRNGRIYPRHLWEREVQKYQANFSNHSYNTLMEWQHPPRAEVDPMEAVGKITKLYIEGKYVMGEAVLLNNQKAEQLKSLIDNQIKICVSSRSVGSMEGDTVKDFNLITYDIVPNPSDYHAEMNGMCESHLMCEGIIQDLHFDIDENGHLVESKDGMCEYTKEEIQNAVVQKFNDIMNTLKG